MKENKELGWSDSFLLEEGVAGSDHHRRGGACDPGPGYMPNFGYKAICIAVYVYL